MSANRFGNRFSITTFGESHGAALGVIIDGCPAGIAFDDAFLKRQLERRRPGGALVSSRQEADLPEVLSGVYQAKTLGTPIAIIVRNHDQRSQDYQDVAEAVQQGAMPIRAGHADDLWRLKFGHSDTRGGGRASGRETVARVMAGAVAQMVLKQWMPELSICGFASQIGPYSLSEDELLKAHDREIDAFPARFPSEKNQQAIRELLENAKHQGLSHGGKAVLEARGVPAGLGQPVFHKLKADLASAFLGVGATSAVEIGEGTSVVEAEGSEFHRASRGQYGGIRGGVSTGETIHSTVSFKPTSSVLDVAKKGRHDPCIVPRAIPVLEAMMALVLVDHFLWQRTDRL